MSKYISGIHKPVHNSWKTFLTEEIIQLITDIEKILNEKGGAVTPPDNRVFHFLSQDLGAVKVLIIGQDPYPQEGVATGRAFEVGSLKSWHDTFRNVSLKNIIRALYQAETGEYLTYSLIRKQLGVAGLFDAPFKLLPPDQLFKHWEQEGVLLLNTSFTCQIGKPGSHAKLWSEFTRELLTFINAANSEINWFLWGNHARGITDHLTLKNSFASNHPMICKVGESDFLFGCVNPFKATAKMIDWTGKSRL
ncbi:MAG: uracil-DNA glycosylase [Marinilabiliaceae bacterium]|nr:uracil-DNA glycosylase [Marinilabiliaceae bacterium]